VRGYKRTLTCANRRIDASRLILQSYAAVWCICCLAQEGKVFYPDRFFEQHIVLRTELDTKYGLEVKEEVGEKEP
jgi:hypothetical protein